MTCKESCPGKNVEACLGACPSDLESFGVCVRVCNWRCPGGGKDVHQDNCPPCPTCSDSPNFGAQEDYEEYDSTPYDEQQYEQYDYSDSEDEYKNTDVEIVQAVNYDYDYGNEGSAGIARGM